MAGEQFGTKCSIPFTHITGLWLYESRSWCLEHWAPFSFEIKVIMDNLTVKNISRSREEWMAIANLPNELKNSVLTADVLIVPSMMSDQPKAFMVGTMDTLAVLKKQFGDKAEICISDDDYVEIELDSRNLRLGKFIVVNIALNLFLNVLGNVISDRIKEPDPVIIEVEAPEFQQPATVSFSITVEDSIGNRKEFQYEGPAADYKDISKEIERLWNED